jgi:hypothetical protein
MKANFEVVKIVVVAERSEVFERNGLPARVFNFQQLNIVSGHAE